VKGEGQWVLLRWVLGVEGCRMAPEVVRFVFETVGMGSVVERLER
jgi:hypothetical protein